MAGKKNSSRANIVEFRGLQDARGLKGVAFGGFIESENTDITRDSKPERRPGRTKVYTGEVTDTWGDGVELLFLTADSDLRRLDSSESSVVLRAGVTGVGRIAAARVASTTYWSYGTHTGVVTNGVDRAFGMAQISPAGVSVIAGSSHLAAGIYRYAWAAVTAEGEEGPIGLRGRFELTERGGVYLVPPITTEARASKVRAYMTEANGTQLYRLGEVDAPANSGEQDARLVMAQPLMDAVLPAREDLHALPAFSAAAVHNGRLLVAYENLLLYSDRFDYEYFAPDEMFIPFSSKVQIIAPVERGVFVGTDTDHYFLDGADIAGAAFRHKASYGAVPNTLDYLEQKEQAFEGVAERVAVWTGVRGPVFGLPNGQMEDTGDGVVSFPAGVVHGSGGVRHHQGDAHYISIVRYRE